jgi:hypothetical protein
MGMKPPRENSTHLFNIFFKDLLHAVNSTPVNALLFGDGGFRKAFLEKMIHHYGFLLAQYYQYPYPGWKSHRAVLSDAPRSRVFEVPAYTCSSNIQET